MTLMYPNGVTVIISQPIMGVYNIGLKAQRAVPKPASKDNGAPAETESSSRDSLQSQTFFPIPFYINPYYKPQPKPVVVQRPVPVRSNSLSLLISLEQDLFKVDKTVVLKPPAEE